MMTREELDTAIVDAVDTYREAKRAELEIMVEKATDAWKEDYVDTCSDDNASWHTLRDALVALREHSKEYTQRTKTREELVKAVDDAKFVCADAYDAASAADAAYTSAADAADAAFAALKAYDKENT